MMFEVNIIHSFANGKIYFLLIQDCYNGCSEVTKKQHLEDFEQILFKMEIVKIILMLKALNIIYYLYNIK